MKSFSFFSLLSIFLFFLGCEKQNVTDAQLQKGCCGIFLRVGDKDFRVSNPTIVDKFAEGTTTVKASFVKVAKCDRSQNNCLCITSMDNGCIKITHIE